MVSLRCSGCGTLYPLEGVARVGRFDCPVCGTAVVAPSVIDTAAPPPLAGTDVPVARPVASWPAPPPSSPPAARPAARPAAQPPRPSAPPQRPPVVAAPAAAAAAPAVRAAPARTSRRPGRPDATPLWIAAACVVVVGVALVAVLRRGSGGDAAASTRPAAAPSAATPAAPAADPDQDPAAWKALPVTERAARTKRMLDGLDRKRESALWWAKDFFQARGEADALKQVCGWAIEQDVNCAWAREALGHADVRPTIDAAVAECPTADELDAPEAVAFHALRKRCETPRSKWWADAATRAELDRAIEAMRGAEEGLRDPYRRAIAKWTVYQRKLEVMREHPSVQRAVGPYLLFVQVKAPADTPLEKVEPGELQRAQRVLNQNAKLFEEFYAAWCAEMVPLLGLTTYAPSNVDEKTLLKANIFADETTWRRYHERRGLTASVRHVRAYYEADEPRFIVSHDGPSREDPAVTDQIQCHEATHQLIHLHTWDQTRKATGKEPVWADCNTDPYWNSEGFAEFFSAHRVQGGRRRWMAPLDRRLRDLHVLGEVFRRKAWSGIGLEELLATQDHEDLCRRAAERVSKKPPRQRSSKELAEIELAEPLLGNLFYARAWSLVHFLWHAETPEGRPKWRRGYVDFLKRQLQVEYAADPKLGVVAQRLSPADFRKALGVEDDVRFRQLEAEWESFEAALRTKEFKRDWDVERDQALRALGLVK